MESEQLTLVKPTADLKDAFLAMVADFDQAGEPRYARLRPLLESDFDAYIRHLENQSAGRNLADGLVPMSVFWLVRNDCDVVGVTHLRHRLNPSLEHEGGHIGYHIRPSARRRGYATVLLSLAIERLRSFGWNRVLVTCNAENVASARVIEKNGGKLAGQVISNETGMLVSRYWIDF
ncbi:MAG TPA: GNAT family N-acetyltransferase [Anaerolineaceae bacterium]|nr:GNAT family N-acetyltransferase [Anaerolineaceae bacterium]